MNEPRYWVCHVRGAEFSTLTKLGFIHFYPTEDSYAYLQIATQNLKLLTTPGLKFLSHKGTLVEISHQEIQKMRDATTGMLVAGVLVEGVTGTYAGLMGTVMHVSEKSAVVQWQLKTSTRVDEVSLSEIAMASKVEDKMEGIENVELPNR